MGSHLTVSRGPLPETTVELSISMCSCLERQHGLFAWLRSGTLSCNHECPRCGSNMANGVVMWETEAPSLKVIQINPCKCLREKVESQAARASALWGDVLLEHKVQSVHLLSSTSYIQGPLSLLWTHSARGRRGHLQGSRH